MADDDQPFSDKSFDEFWLSGLFPEAGQLFSVHQKPIAEIKSHCIVGLDANVLLLPYELGSSSFSKIAEVYRNISKEKRLIVPAQVAREFIKNRAARLRDLVKNMNDQAESLKFTFPEQVSFLGNEKSFKSIKKQGNVIDKAKKEILSEISVLRKTLTDNVGADPVSTEYREILAKCVVDIEHDEKSHEDLRCEAEWRYRHKIPPGYKDRGKEDGGLGDFIIWKTLLKEAASRKKDLIFVTKDLKGDWWVQSQGAFQPRIELIEEFYRHTGGRTIHMISLSQLLEIFEVAKDAVTDVRRAEENVTNRTLSSYRSPVGARRLGWDENVRSRYENMSIRELLDERRRLDNNVKFLIDSSAPVRKQLDSEESHSEDELELLLRRERRLRHERSRLRRLIHFVDQELNKRSDRELNE